MSFCQSGKALPDKYRPCGRAMVNLGTTSNKGIVVEVCSVCDKADKGSK